MLLLLIIMIAPRCLRATVCPCAWTLIMALAFVASQSQVSIAQSQSPEPDPGGWSSQSHAFAADQFAPQATSVQPIQQPLQQAVAPPLKPAVATPLKPAGERPLNLLPVLRQPAPEPSPTTFSGQAFVRANQPATLPALPPARVRRQIGLATFDSPIPPAASIERAPTAVNRVAAAPPAEVLPRTQRPNEVSDARPLPSAPFDISSIGRLFSGAARDRSPDGVSNDSGERTGLDSSIKAALLLATLSLAPAIVLMTTSYVRVVVVLSLLRQAFGSQQLPPTQVITALSLFVTMLVMTPVWNEVKQSAIDPYTASGSEMTWNEAWDAGIMPVRRFMQKQIELAGNANSISTFYKYSPEASLSAEPPQSLDDVPLNVLLPAFMVSELKVAFLLGFQVFLPFLVLDLVVSSVTVSMGMLMLPPNMVSFPLKLILFVMVDGWNLVVGMLLQSFGPFS